MKKSIITLSIISLFLFSCKNENKDKTRELPKRNEPKNVAFTLESTTTWLQKRYCIINCVSSKKIMGF